MSVVLPITYTNTGNGLFKKDTILYMSPNKTACEHYIKCKTNE